MPRYTAYGDTIVNFNNALNHILGANYWYVVDSNDETITFSVSITKGAVNELLRFEIALGASEGAIKALVWNTLKEYEVPKTFTTTGAIAL